ncbi:hypothetical protein [Kordiimonas gwangyangensis]|uniref:hypothetical protein n=1 Tax=Kordiimonas gwangyangensis TaxID=288022 RepID=UPI0004715C45|nr:hypothetical protein [Kordiimonas gwangyangensis]
MGPDTSKRQEFAIFLAKLPTSAEKIYLVLSRPYRLGRSDSKHVPEKKVEDKKQEFYERLENLFDGNPEAAQNMLVTVLEAGAGQQLDDDKLRDIEQHLKSYSVGGAHATMLGDDKFAVVHDKTEPSTNLAEEVKRATGVNFTSATIDAAEAQLSDTDSCVRLYSACKTLLRTKKASMSAISSKTAQP